MNNNPTKNILERTNGLFNTNIKPYLELEYLILVVIIGFALIVRLTGISKGLPYLHHYDEPFIASRALMMLKTGDFNPHWFQYPSLMTYANLFVDIFHYLYLMGQEATQYAFNGLNDIKVDNPTAVQRGKYIWTISHPSFYLWNRALTVFIGTLCVFYTYLLSKRLSNKVIVGIIAAAFMAVSSTMIYHSRFITPNLPVVLFALGCTYYAVEYYTKKKSIYLLISLVFAGLAISTKYNLGICLIVPLSAYWTNHKKFKVNVVVGTFISVAIAFLVFFIVNPYIIADFTQFLSDIGRQIKHYKTGHGSHTIEPGLTHLIFQLKEYNKDFGLLLMITSGVGFFVTFKYRGGWLIGVLTVLYMAYMVRQKVDFHRNFLVMYPFICLWIAFTIEFISAKIRNQISNLKNTKTPGWIRSVLPNLLYIIVFVFIAFDGLAELRKAEKLADHIETRSAVITHINKLADQRIAKIAIAKELRMHREDLSRLKISFDEIGHADFGKYSSKYDFFITGKFGSGRKSLKEKDSIFNTIYNDLEIIKKIEGRTIRIKPFSVDPTIYIYKGDAEKALNLSPESFRGWYGVNESNIFVGASGGVYETRPINFDPGLYELRTKIRGNLANNETAKLDFYLDQRLLNEITTSTEFIEEIIRFKIDSQTTTSLKIDFKNDYFNQNTSEDRNFYMKEFSIQKVN